MDWGSTLSQVLDLLRSQLDSMLRLVLAGALGGVIGLERESSGKPAGFRTNLLICVGAALLTELSVYMAGQAHLIANATADPARLAAQIVSGIGFLGAGTIIQSRGSVHGLTTAATLWVVAAIGIAVGAEAYLLAVVATAVVMVALRTLGRMEPTLLRRQPVDRTVTVELARPDQIEDVEAVLRERGVRVGRRHVERRDHGCVASFEIELSDDGVRIITQKLAAQPVVRRLTIT